MSAMAMACVSAEQTITGVRTWRFIDGTERRSVLSKVEGGVATLTGGGDKLSIPVAKFIPEQQVILQAVADGTVVRTRYPLPGVSTYANLENQDEKIKEALKYVWLISLEREWTKLDGKSVRGALYNLTDDVIHLLIRGVVWKVSISDLSDGDRRFLEEVKKGHEELLPHRVWFPATFMVAGTEAWISGERFLDDVAPRVSLHQVIGAAMDEISSKLDERYWEFKEITETGIALHDSLAKKIPNYDLNWSRKAYVAKFQIMEKKIGEAQKAFPNRVSDDGRCYLSFFDDGKAPEMSFESQKK